MTDAIAAVEKIICSMEEQAGNFYRIERHYSDRGCERESLSFTANGEAMRARADELRAAIGKPKE